MKSCPYYPEFFDCPEEANDMVAKKITRHQQQVLDMIEYDHDPLPKKIRECCSGEEIVKYFTEHSKAFILRGLQNYIFSGNDWKRVHFAMKKGREVIFPKITHLSLSQMVWKDELRNTHYCPRDGITNFRMEKDLPKSYPGWYGRLTMKCDSSRILIRQAKGSKDTYRPIRDAIHGSKMFCEETGIHTGSGGGSYTDLSYEVFMFASDFPGLLTTKENIMEVICVKNQMDDIDKKMEWAILSGKSHHALSKKKESIQADIVKATNNIAYGIYDE